MNYMAAQPGGEDVYATFNMLMRRKVGRMCEADGGGLGLRALCTHVLHALLHMAVRACLTRM